MSVIHRLDTRIKLMLVFLFAVLIFFVDKFLVSVYLTFFFICILLIYKYPFHKESFKFKDRSGAIKNIRNLSLLAAFIILMQTLFGPGENYGYLPFKREGFILGLIIFCRLISLIILFFVFSQTTSPHQLALSLCSFGFNYRSAFVITTAFNMVPFFRDEAFSIMDAQKLRGMRSFEAGSFFGRMKAYSSLAVPLVLGAMRKAQISSVAMDSRAFGVNKTRTWLDMPKMKTCDFLAVFFCVLFSASVLFINKN